MKQRLSFSRTGFILISCLSLLVSVGMYTQSARAQSGQISVELTGPGAAAGDTIICSKSVTFNIRYFNNTGYNIWGMTNGYRLYSPTGAVWTTPVYDTTGGLDNYFDYIIQLYGYSIDGSGADTIGLGTSIMTGTGLPHGFNDIVLTITTELDNLQDGLTLCIDSCFFPPGGTWIWATSAGNVYPDWGGPYCFDLFQPPPPEITAISPTQNALNVTTSANITVTFDMDMDETTINASTFVVNARSTGRHQGLITYDSFSKTATFNPSNDFVPGEIVTVTLTDGIESDIGVSMDNGYLWSFTVIAAIGPANFVEDSAYAVDGATRGLYCADFNGDGYIDFAASNADADNVSVRLNDGTGVFGTLANYPVSDDPQSVFAADLDGDNDIDIITANRNADSVSVLMNNGSGIFSAYVTYPVGLAPFYVYAADLDGDGDNDLAVANNDSHNISILINNGSGIFASGGTCATPNYPNSVHAADLDDDGDLDLVTANYFSTVSVLLNNGNATFAASIEYTVTYWPFYAFPADLDNDGDLDLAVANYGSHTVTTLLNNGSGVFGSLASYPVGVYPRSIAVCDFDGDGNLDLAVSNTQSDDVSILMNNGNATFNPHVTYPVGDAPVAIFGADFDDDGDVDLAVANFVDSTVSILLNEPNPQILFTNPTQNALNVSASTNITVTFDIAMDETTINASTFVVNARSTGRHQGLITYEGSSKTATFNPNDDFEVGDIVTVVLTTGIKSSTGVSMNSGYIWSFTVLVNNGYGIFVERASYYVSSNPISVSPISVNGGDFNGDGYIDLVTANTEVDSITILINPGNGFFPNHASYAVGDEPLNVLAANLDSDNDLDLVTFNSTGSISVLMNYGNGTFSTHVDYPVIIPSLGYGHIADLDGDGDLDLATPSFSSRRVIIFLNDGSGNFSDTASYTTGYFPISVSAADLDGDGDLDLTTANYAMDIVSILFNNGDATFAPNVDYAVGVLPFFVQPADLNGDGALDLAVVNRSSNNVTVLMNDGSGLFLPGTSYQVGSGPMSIVTSDFDSDGNLDLATSNSGSDSISVLLGNGGGTFGPHVTIGTGDEPRSIYAADFDGDGDIDLATANKNSSTVSILSNMFAIIAKDPDEGMNCIDTTSSIRVRFNTSVDQLTVSSGSTFQVENNSGPISGTIVLFNSSTVVFFPDNGFDTADVVTVTLTTGIQSVAGAPLFSDVSWKFATLSGKLSFHPEPDGWKFANTQDNMWPGRTFFPSWELWVDAFGEGHCYWEDPIFHIKVEKPWMVERWLSVAWMPYEGSCFGFAITSLLFYDGFLLLGNMFNEIFLHNVILNDASRDFINKYQVHMFGKSHLAYNAGCLRIKPNKTLNDCRTMFRDGVWNDQVLTMLKTSWVPGGHSVTPYKCGPDPYNPNRYYYIYVYDSNYPAADNLRVRINTQNNTWSYNGKGSDWGGSTLLYLQEPTSYYTVLPNKQDQGLSEDLYANERSSDFDNHRMLFFTAVDSVYLESPEGYVGYSTDSLFVTDTNAAPIIIPTGGEGNPPYGYLLPRVNWKGWFYNISDTMFHYTLFLDSTLMNYSREGADSTQNEHLDYREYDSSLMIHNPGTGNRLYDFKTVSMAADSQFVVAISDINISPGDSIRYSFTDEPELQLDNYGGGTTYGLQLEMYNAEEFALFYCGEVPLGANTSHRIKPDWRPFDDAAMIMIDEGMTGVYSDTFYCPNEGVDICIPGDANGSATINLLDVTYLISYLYKGGPAPDPIESGDANGSGSINLLDITYLINYLYKGGSEPVCP